MDRQHPRQGERARSRETSASRRRIGPACPFTAARLTPALFASQLFSWSFSPFDLDMQTRLDAREARGCPLITMTMALLELFDVLVSRCS